LKQIAANEVLLSQAVQKGNTSGITSSQVSESDDDSSSVFSIGKTHIIITAEVDNLVPLSEMVAFRMCFVPLIDSHLV
jgi:hypothetical protein